MNSLRLSIVFMVSFLMISSSQSWILPIKLIEPFHPINLKQVTCPRSRDAPSTRSNGLILLKIDTIKNIHPEIKGYICSKTSLTSRCDTTAFFFTSKTKIAKLSKPTINECLEALIRRKSGMIDLPLIDPPHVCSWTGIQDETNSQVSLVEKKVFYDPYHNKLMSIIFPNHECSNTNYCMTIKDHEIWIPEEKDKHYCEFIRSSGTITYNLGDPLNGAFTHTIHYGNSISKSCWIDICGRSGIRLEDKSWISIIDPSNTTSSIISSLYPCSAEASIQNTKLESKLTLKEEILILYHRICQMKLQKIKNVTKLHSNDLSFLAPVTPGQHPIYLFRGGLILKGLGLYDFIRTNEKSSYDTTHEIKELWEKVNKTDSSYLGPNGIYSINNTLHMTDDEFDYNMISELMGTYKLDVISRDIKLETLSDRFEDDEIILETHDEIHTQTSDFMNEIGSFFSGIFSGGLSTLYKIIMLVGVIIVAVLMIPCSLNYLLKKISNLKWGTPSSRRHHILQQQIQEDFELHRLESGSRRLNHHLVPLN